MRALNRRRRHAIRMSLTLLTVLFAGRALAEDWPQWRGPRGDGSSLEANIATQWDGPSGKNILWRVEIPGEGHSSPIVCGDRIFLTSCVTESTKRVLFCLHRDTGQQLWQSTVFAGQLETIHALNSRASGTPTTDGEHIYVAFMRTDGRKIRAPNVGTPRDITVGEMVVAAFDFTGRQTWLVKPGEFISAHGFSSCPILFRDLLIVNGDHDGNSYIVGLDKTTGKERWRRKREYGIRSYVTPIIRFAAGRTQMVFSGSDRIISLNPENGDLHWLVEGPTEQCVASMVYDGQLFYMTCGFPDHFVLAVRPDGKGDVTESAVVWESRQARSYVPSPVVFNGYLLVADDRGTANCFETKTGTRLWQERFGGGFSASLIHAGGLAYLIRKDGEMAVVRPGKTLDVIARNELGESVSASPAISNGRIYIRGEKSLFCIGKSSHASDR